MSHPQTFTAAGGEADGRTVGQGVAWPGQFPPEIRFGALRLRAGPGEVESGTEAIVSEAGVEIARDVFRASGDGGFLVDVPLGAVRARVIPFALDVLVAAPRPLSFVHVVRNEAELLAGAGSRVGAATLTAVADDRLLFEIDVTRFVGLPLDLEVLVDGVRCGRAASAPTLFRTELREAGVRHEAMVTVSRPVSRGDRITLVHLGARRTIVYERTIEDVGAVATGGAAAVNARLEALEKTVAALRADLDDRTGPSAVRAVNDRLELINRLLVERLDDFARALQPPPEAAAIADGGGQTPAPPLDCIQGVGLDDAEAIDGSPGRRMARWTTIVLREAGAAGRLRLTVDPVAAGAAPGLSVRVDGVDVEVDVIDTAPAGRRVLSVALPRAERWGGQRVVALIFSDHAPVDAAASRFASAVLRKIELA